MRRDLCRMRFDHDHLSSDDIRPLAERSDLWGLWHVAHAWGVMAGAVAGFAIWPHVLTFLLAVMVIGSRQLGLAILMHEAAHNALFKTRALNETIGQWLCARPILADLSSYRSYHLKHHRYTQTDQDPDLVLSKPFPTTRASMKRKLIRDITGQTGYRQRAAQVLAAIQAADKDDEDRLAQAFTSPTLKQGALVNVGLFVLLWLVGAWWWYLAFWALPLLTWFQLVVRIRNIAEHGAVGDAADPLRNTRTTYASLIERAFLAPYWVNYHLEHHMVMHVPCHNLPKLHALLLSRNLGPRMEIGRSYWHVMAKAASRSA